jgi:hypothetical protein
MTDYKLNYITSTDFQTCPDRLLRPTQPPVQWVLGFLSPGQSAAGAWRWPLTPYLVQRSRMSRSYTSSPPQMPPWCVAGQLCFDFQTSTNIVVKWLTLLLHNQEVPGSNIGSETGYPDWGISWFFSVPPGNAGIVS